VLSGLDTVYATKLKALNSILGEINFVYFMSVWSIAYAECINEGLYLPHYQDRDDLFRRVLVKRKFEPDLMKALLLVLDEDHPDVTFHFSLGNEDIYHNARYTQICQVLDLLQGKLREVEVGIREYEKQVPISQSKMNLGPFLRGKMRHLSLIKPEFRFGGEDGQLTELKKMAELDNPQSLADAWLKKVQKILKSLDLACMFYPTPKVALCNTGPVNDSTYVTCLSVCLNLKNLADELHSHMASGELKAIAKLDSEHFKTSAINLKTSYELISKLYYISASGRSQKISDFSEAWAYLYLGVASVSEGIHKTMYS
jgi:hypothetical protein